MGTRAPRTGQSIGQPCPRTQHHRAVPMGARRVSRHGTRTVRVEQRCPRYVPSNPAFPVSPRCVRSRTLFRGNATWHSPTGDSNAISSSASSSKRRPVGCAPRRLQTRRVRVRNTVSGVESGAGAALASHDDRTWPAIGSLTLPRFIAAPSESPSCSAVSGRVPTGIAEGACRHRAVPARTLPGPEERAARPIHRIEARGIRRAGQSASSARCDAGDTAVRRRSGAPPRFNEPRPAGPAPSVPSPPLARERSIVADPSCTALPAEQA